MCISVGCYVDVVQKSYCRGGNGKTEFYTSKIRDGNREPYPVFYRQVQTVYL